MSLHDILMERAALQFQNDLEAPNPLVQLAQGVAVGIEEARQKAMEREEIRKNFKESLEQINQLPNSIKGRMETKISYNMDNKGTLIPSVSISQKSNNDREVRLEKEQQLRDFRNDFNSAFQVGGTVSSDFINRAKENLGVDVQSSLEAGRGEPIVNRETGERSWRILSDKEYARKIEEGKFSPTEVEYIQNISDEQRKWLTAVDRLKSIGIDASSAGQIEFEDVNTPLGVISLPARFNLYGQFAKDPKYTAIKRDIEQAFQSFRKTTTGAQASDKELRMLRPLIASLKDRPEVFFETVANRIENLELMYNDRLDIYESVGRDTSKLRGMLETRRQEVTGQSNSFASQEEALKAIQKDPSLLGKSVTVAGKPFTFKKR